MCILYMADTTLDYRLLGEAGWEQVDLFDGDKLIWSRNLHQELGFSAQRIRLRLGGRTNQGPLS
ncbi:hypothetical protein QFZ84_000464 [Pseudomonas fluorescens]